MVIIGAMEGLYCTGLLNGAKKKKDLSFKKNDLYYYK